MKNIIISASSGLLVGAAAVYLLAPQKIEKQVELLERVVTVTQYKEVEVTKIVKNDVVVERKVTETRPDKTTVVTEEKIVDRTTTDEKSKETAKVETQEQTKQQKITESRPVFKPFEVIVTVNPAEAKIADGGQVLLRFQPIEAIPIGVVTGVSNFNKLNAQIGLSFAF